MFVLSPVEDRSKPLDEIEYNKRRAIFIAAAELLIGLAFMLVGLDNMFAAVVYSFAALSFMLVVGKIKNHRLVANSPNDD